MYLHGNLPGIKRHVVRSGCESKECGQFAADFRSLRETGTLNKGKGVRYQGEYVKIKPG